MKASLKPLLLAALLAGAALPALAEPAGGPAAAPCAVKADGERHAYRQARWQDRMARRAAELKTELKLSAEQEAAWTTYLAAMKPPADAAAPQRSDLSQLTTPERLDRLRELHQQRDAAFEQREAATRAFYGALNAEQQKIFDQRIARAHQHGRHRHHG
jgi:hypothetical protein